MSKSGSNETGKNIWSLITMEQLVTAIASLGDRVDVLQDESWRIKDDTELQSSLWAEVIRELKIHHTEKIRHSLYNIWYLERRGIRILVKKEIKRINRHKNDGDHYDANETGQVSVSAKNNTNLVPDLSLPIPQKPITRINQAQNVNENNTQSLTVDRITIDLNVSEWKAAFSCSRQKMNDGWTKIFYDKLKSSGIKCAVKFDRSHIIKGRRKRECKKFWCRAVCPGSKCTRSFLITLENKPDVKTPALFLVQISGIENHDPETETIARQLRGDERYRIGKKLWYFFSEIISL
jgi:hypothetical protein